MRKRLRISNKTIEADIAGFKERIREAEIKLSDLPSTAAGWKDRQKLKGQRQTLESEIRHVNNLIRIAQEALTGTNDFRMARGLYTIFRASKKPPSPVMIRGRDSFIDKEMMRKGQKQELGQIEVPNKDKTVTT